MSFSGDGRELIAGLSGGMFVVYDLEMCTDAVRNHEAHHADVNCVSFAHDSNHIIYSRYYSLLVTKSPIIIASAEGDFITKSNLPQQCVYICRLLSVLSIVIRVNEKHDIYSSGDDGVLKIWDRRIMNERAPQPVSVFVGHSHGITRHDSREDLR